VKPLYRGPGLLVLLAALGLVFSAAAVRAQGSVWLPRGPVGGNVYCLVPDPTRPATLYAGTDEGVHKSTDGGATWQASNAGIAFYRVQTIAVDPTNPSTLYAGTITPDGVESVGIFKSTDGGATWTDSNIGLIDPVTGISPLDIETLAFDPRHAGSLWAGSKFSEIFQSTDGGATWTARTYGGINISLETSAFFFDPSNASTILAASSFGLLRTTDAGSTWNTFGNVNVSFFSMVADPTSPATLYAGNTSGTGLYKSTDDGNHWTTINKGLTVNQSSSGTVLPLITSIAVDPSRPTTVYAASYGNGLFQSTDGGATWSSISGSMRSSYVWAVLLSAGQSSTVYAATLGGGVYQSLDTGRTFAPVNQGLQLGVVYALLRDPVTPSTIYAGAFDGFYKSTDGGATFQPSLNGLPVAPVAALALRPGSPETLLAGTRGAGIYRSTDGGATWTASSQGLNDSYFSSITVDPSNSSTVYAGTSHPYDGSTSERVWKSTDGGATWTQTSLDAQGFSVTFITVNASKTSQVIAGSEGLQGYFQSLDSGKTWTTVTAAPVCGGVNSVSFDASGATMYIAGTSGLCRSTDGAKTWTVSGVASLASVENLLIDPSNTSSFYVGTQPELPGAPGGVFQSNDAGQTWQAVGTGLESTWVTAILLNPADKSLIASTHGNGIASLVVTQNRQSITRPTRPSRQTRILKPR
jgi:photosystem II stability/assembly factor-like uncharacterized protein